MATEVVIMAIDTTPVQEQPDVMGEVQREDIADERASDVPEKQLSETAVGSDSSAHGAEMLIRLKEGAGYVYSVPQGYITQMAHTEVGSHGDGMDKTEQGVTQADSQKTSFTKQNSVAIQANDYEIERRSGVLPARRRLVPFKFRDFQNSIDLTGDDPEDEDYDPSEEAPEPKRPRKTIPRPGARGVGRPRKVRKDHAYDRTGEGKGQVENTDAADGTTQEGEQANDDTAKKKAAADRQFPRRGRPPKDDPYQRPKVFKCLQCDRKFSLKGNLKVHMRTHTDERPFRCELPECDKSFRSNESLRRHNLAHQGIKLFACDICEKRFSSNVALTEHMARHTDVKTQICPFCQRAFRQLSCLRRHMTTHTDSQPHQCTVCEKRFSQAVYLRSHMRSHTGERPYQCDTCGKSFAHQSDKMRHMTIHLGTKPYPCEVCEARFSDPSTRRRHVREHNGFKPYTCQLCGDNFKRSGQLKAHLNKKHMNYKEDVLITKEGPFNALQFQFKGNKNTGVAEQLQAEQLAAGNTQTKYVQQQQQIVAAPGQEGQVITLAPGQDNIQVIDENGHIQHLQIQHVDVGGEQPARQTQVLGQLQQQLVQTAVGQQQLEGYQIILPQSSSGSQEELLEETQKIIQQIQSQLEPSGDMPGGQQVKVAYQILHDDDNQQIVEIQYHQVEEEGQGEADQGQGVVTLIEDQDQAETAEQQQNRQQQQQEQLQQQQQEDMQQQQQQQHLQQEQLHQEEQHQENLRQVQRQQEQLQNEHLEQEQSKQEQLTESQIDVELMEAAQSTEHQQEQQESQVITLEQFPEQVQLPVEEHETAANDASPQGEQLGAVLETDGVAVFQQEEALCHSEEFASQPAIDCQPMEEQVLHSAPVQQVEGYDDQQEAEQLTPTHEQSEYEMHENVKTEGKQTEGPESELTTEHGQYSQKVLDSGEATLLTLQTLEQQQQQASVDYVSNPDFGCQEYYNWLSNFTELCKLVPIPLDVDLFQKISQVHKTLSDVLATPRGILTNKENFRTLMNISRELNGIISEHLNFVLHNLDTDIDME